MRRARAADPSRRGFLIGGALVAGALPSGCGRSSTSIGPTDTFTAAFQGSGAGEGIDPGVNTLFLDEVRMEAVYDGLFEVASSMTPLPRSAVSAEPNADGTKWRIVLRGSSFEFLWAESTPGPEKHAEIYRTMHEILYDRGGLVFFGNTHWNSAADKRYRGMPASVSDSPEWARFDRTAAL
ncbi:hypothetical protein [Nocardia brevicatena]|uniref:hypothetical protein n=1 Tax=Nocardia brevicatena TaxID=37327 RepID=UPI0002E79C05|nr:hypothetical protein [Nocardia brevicatena]